VTIDLDKVLEDLAAMQVVNPLKTIDDEKAAALCSRLADVRAQLEGGRYWWEQRRTALKRQEEWLLANLEIWSVQTSRATSLKTFPCGRGTAKVSKARTRTNWTEQADDWMRKIVRVDPECAKAFDHARVLDEYVSWAAPNGKGIREACAKRDVGLVDADGANRGAMALAKGEILKGLTRDERPGILTVSINTDARD
jgi:hypothetical protein